MSAVIVLVIRILIAVSLYLFLGLALITLWKEIRASEGKNNRVPIPELVLTYSNELEHTRAFSQQEVMIGREASSDLVIADDTVSSHHARFSYHHKQWWLEDLQSTNGTFLNNERLYTSTVIVSGDEVTLGNITIQVEIKSIKSGR